MSDGLWPQGQGGARSITWALPLLDCESRPAPLMG